MKKITTLLLGLVLLLPALALAEEVPTFDFTAEEWLERYATLVPEDDPYYFTEFNNPELVGQTSRFFFRRQEFSTPADYIEVDSMKKEENVCLITVMTPYPYSGIELDPLLQSYESLRNMAERCILAVDPMLTSEDILAIYTDLGMFEYVEDRLYAPIHRTHNGITYTFGMGSGPYIAISMVNDPSVF